MNNKNIKYLLWNEIFNKYPESNFSNHAFPLFLFIERLYNSAQKNNYKNILFMSREGWFLKKLFERYCEIKKEFNQEVADIKTKYFYGSRNSIMCASVKPLDKEDFEMMFRFFKYFIKPSAFLFSIGFSTEQINEVRLSFGKKLDKPCFNFKKSKILQKLKHDEVFKRIYEENRNKQSKAFNDYIKTLNVDYKNEGFVFVDIGYHGTMQDLIYKFFDEKIKIQGYYIKNRSISTSHNSKIGLLGDNVNKHLLGSKITKYDTFNYEQILRANHGRCLGYQIDNNSIKPQLDSEHCDEEIYEKYVKHLQQQIFEKFELIAKNAFSGNYDMEKICSIYFYYTVKKKTKSDFKWILDMQDCHHDDFGYVGYPGKAFARWLRMLAFKLKDKLFLFNNKLYVNKLKNH